MVLQEPNKHGTAPLIELKYARNILRYERVKLTLLVVVLLINLGIGGYLLGTAHSNHDLLVSSRQGLVILQCAVDPNVSVKPDGTARTDDEKRVAFQACVKAGGPR